MPSLVNKEQLRSRVLDTFRRPELLEQFLSLKMNVRLQELWPQGSAYRDVVFTLIQELETDNRLREFVRKLWLAHPDDQKLNDFALNACGLTADESLVGLLEEAHLDPTALEHAFEIAVPGGPQPPAWREGLQSEQVDTYATACEAVVDDLAGAALIDQHPLKLPLLIFCENLLAASIAAADQQTDASAALVQQLRSAIRNLAAAHNIQLVDVVLVHAPDDAEWVKRLAFWLQFQKFAVKIQPPEPRSWTQLAREAQQNVGRVAVCIGPQTKDDWWARAQTAEASLLRGGQLITILHQVPYEEFPLLEPKYAVAIANIDDTAALELLKSRLGGTDAPIASSTTTPLIADAVKDLVGWIRTDEIVYLLGPAASRPPSGYAMSRALLERLNVRIGDDHLGVPVDLAGMYYAIKNNDPNLEDEIRRLLDTLSVPASPGRLLRPDTEPTLTDTVPPTYRALVELLNAAAALRHTGRSAELVDRRPLLVTTNLDVRLERALLLGGVSFTRIVQHRADHSFVVTHYTVNTSPTEITVGDVVLSKAEKTWENFDRVIRTSPSRRETSGTPALEGDSSHTVLYKYSGSLDVSNSCAVSTEHYDDFDAAQVPQVIRKRITTKPLLAIGYSFTDPEFRHVRRTLLKSLAENKVDRYALVYPLPSGAEGTSYQIERILSQRAQKIWKSAKLTAIECEGHVLLDEIVAALQPDKLERTA